jgi:hypothetical protein
LGERLVAQMGLETSTDTLARWMAHRVAELIGRPDEANDEAKREATSLILRLWAKRSSWPHGWPPPKTAEVLKRLEPQPNPVRSREADVGSPWLSRMTDLDELQYAERQVWLRLTLSESDLEGEIAMTQHEGTDLTDEELAVFRSLAFHSRLAVEHFGKHLDEDTPLARAELAKAELSEIAKRRTKLFRSAVKDVVKACDEGD